jgi:hypothetical protein
LTVGPPHGTFSCDPTTRFGRRRPANSLFPVRLIYGLPD